MNSIAFSSYIITENSKLKFIRICRSIIENTLDFKYDLKLFSKIQSHMRIYVHTYIHTCACKHAYAYNYVLHTCVSMYIVTPIHTCINVTQHEKIGLMYTQNLTTFLDFKLK